MPALGRQPAARLPPASPQRCWPQAQGASPKAKSPAGESPQPGPWEPQEHPAPLQPLWQVSASCAFISSPLFPSLSLLLPCHGRGLALSIRARSVPETKTWSWQGSWARSQHQHNGSKAATALTKSSHGSLVHIQMKSSSSRSPGARLQAGRLR